jgi:hypothetical protein
MYKYKKIKLSDGSTRDEHRLIMEKELGRKLSFNEVVHHIDGNRLNNKRENLELTSRSKHSSNHYLAGDLHKPQMTDLIREKLCRGKSCLSEEVAFRIKYGKEKSSFLMKEFNIDRSLITRIRSGKKWFFI